MTLYTLPFRDPVEVSTTTISAPTYTLTSLASYGAWREVARIGWSDTLDDDKITMTGNVWYLVSSVVSATTDQLALKFRMRLFDETTGAETWGGVFEEVVLRTLGARTAGALDDMVNFNMTFSVRDGYLEPGHAFTIRLEAMKEQQVGTPTMTVAFTDASIFADSATIIY